MHVGYALMLLAEALHGHLRTQTLSVITLNQPSSLHLLSSCGWPGEGSCPPLASVGKWQPTRRFCKGFLVALALLVGNFYGSLSQNPTGSIPR
jgi:hypothetical protein